MCREIGSARSDLPPRIFGGAFRGFAFAARVNRVLRPRCAHFDARWRVDVEAMHRSCSGIGQGHNCAAVNAAVSAPALAAWVESHEQGRAFEGAMSGRSLGAGCIRHNSTPETRRRLGRRAFRR